MIDGMSLMLIKKNSNLTNDYAIIQTHTGHAAELI